jgi:hypothetical protein
MATAREGREIAKKQLAMRDNLWPGVEQHLWHRLANKGFATIPKTFPIILRIMDEMTNGAPVSATYQTLWCNTWDNSYVTIGRASYLAYASGFSGQRAEHTWTTRVKKLHELRFIDIKAGRAGPLTNVIIWNPHLVLRWHHQQKTPGLLEGSYNTLLEWAYDIGAKDMTDEVETIPEPGVVPPPAPEETRKKRKKKVAEK